MPKLKQLTCHVEWTPSNTPFREYGICYGDGVVESYIAIPAGSTPFSINLRSDGFIAPGLAAFVFIDGVYQCNRYRGDLQISDKVRMDCLSDTVNFRVRQKEERLPDGGWMGRPWRFEPLNIGTISPEDRDFLTNLTTTFSRQLCKRSYFVKPFSASRNYPCASITLLTGYWAARLRRLRFRFGVSNVP